ncbi:MAG: HupE/UreJ family protein [Flavobacteriaceae bacterium]|nr:HupE/UreJ family protein [Flavobacteriaceae bacterium]
METFQFYTTLGFQHVTDLNGLDHLYFIVALSLPFGINDWKKLLWWVTLFTLGHSLSLIGNYYAGYGFSSYWIELLIPITIAVGCFPLLLQKRPSTNGFSSVLTFLFGLIHGLGFGRFFAMMVEPDAAIVGLFSFALGVELAQLAIVLAVLLLNFFISKRYRFLKFWRLGLGGIIFLLALVMIVERI